MTNNNDFIIDDNTAQQVRLDIQEAFQQLASNNFGTTPPVTTDATPVQVAYPHQWFANGDTGKLMYKDASTGNNATTNYFNLANLDGGLFVDQTSTFNGDVIFQGTNGTTNITFDADASNGLGSLNFENSSSIRLGANDFTISHMIGTTVFAAQTDKPTLFQTRTTRDELACYTLKTADSSGADEAYEAFVNGHQVLHFNGTEKFRTSASGITVTGSVTTQDINMSNLNSLPNEVDNTQGSWSIQEGSDDLFLINRINGKKYKFNLTEVS